jgi:hypothetical protein
MDTAIFVKKATTNSWYVADRSRNLLAGVVLFGLLMSATACGTQTPEDISQWVIYITNDNCPDYTWGYTEEQTRQSFADIIRGHLDEMNRTDDQGAPNRDCYNMAVTQEALCFIERYPQRKAELIDRIKQGRVYVSPYFCNALWALQSTEGAIRTFYPARRLEREWGSNCIGAAEHIEQPCLPWGVVPILAGCSIRWLAVPFYKYDSTFDGLKNPPIFIHEGPDGSKVRVILDRWACSKASYTQGAHILGNPQTLTSEWLPHYRSLGEVYPLKIILASGTHGDISPHSGSQARAFAEPIIKYNGQPGPHPTLVNATLPQFCEAVDEVQTKKPFLPTIRGCFGHSWDLWPVSLAKYVADMRQAERTFLAAEVLLAVTVQNQPAIHENTRADREQAEWYWTMLADHAWNGNSEQNKRHNAELRQKWSSEFSRLSNRLLQSGWAGIGLEPRKRTIAVFNSLSFARSGLVRIQVPEDVSAVMDPRLRGGRFLNCQLVNEEGQRILYFVAPEIPAFALRQFELTPRPKTNSELGGLLATPTSLQSPYYRLAVDLQTGGVCSLIHEPTGTKLAVPGKRSLCQTIYFDGKEHTLQNVTSEVVAIGPVLARLKITGMVEGIQVTNFVTVYAELDQVDFDLRINKPVTAHQQRLCQIFPILRDGAVLSIETTGAVIRPRLQPEGDLLAGADARRFAVQGFVDASLPDGIGVTIVPLDAYALRLDLDPLTFEALGNDQNYREVTQDQHGVKDFRFRYVLRAHTSGYRNAEIVAWSRNAASPLLGALGSITTEKQTGPQIEVDPSRAVAMCLKPADGDASGGCILRLWETAGLDEPLGIGLKGYKKVILTDLLERDQKQLQVVNDCVAVKPNPNGFCSLRLLP